ncbi:T9SS type A sorting domain-containing protein [Owenweeksia hongkongensis]|uniref:T9SS type A sorting domain-containing protein n=1 Tax=Owenweeksia hongkongensis TaxID=253245 RepID=UPI003A8F1D3C
MKKLLLSTALLMVAAGAQAQLSENFDSYNVGDYIGVVSPAWTTWSSTTGGAEDAQINNIQSNSGNNSIYFNSTAANGGPQDVVLPFGGAHNVGDFSYSQSMYIPTGKGAYFNFQADATIGNTWALDFYFVDDNSFYVSDPGAGLTVITGTFPSDQWFDVKMEIDLTTNSWEMFINNVSVGSFSNAVNRIASIDFYPTNSNNGGNGLSTFWIDDVSYTYTPYTLLSLNGAAINAEFNGPAINGAARNPEVTIRNLGTTAITSFDIAVDYNGSTISQTVSNVHIPSLDTYTIELSQSVTLTPTANNMVATISNVNGNGADMDPSDDAKTINFTSITPATGKVVIVEEATGTWCGWCPRGTVAMDYLAHDYKGFAAGIAVHNGDPMVNQVYDAGMGNRISGYPSALVDRGSVIDPSDIFSPVLTNLVVAPKAILTNGARYDAASNILEVSVTADFVDAVSGDWRLACAITEDSVHGTESGYGQSNYYSGSQSLVGLNGVDWQNLPSKVPASQMVYDHVARAIAPSFAGYQNSFPASVNANDQHTVNFWFQLEAEFDIDKMHIISMLIKPGGTIDNGGVASVDEAIANGFVSGPNVGVTEYFDGPHDMLNIYPNPANGNFTNLVINAKSSSVAITIVDVNGKTVFAKQLDTPQNETEVLPISTAYFSEGLYLVRVVDGQNTQTQKLIVQ